VGKQVVRESLRRPVRLWGCGNCGKEAGDAKHPHTATFPAVRRGRRRSAVPAVGGTNPRGERRAGPEADEVPGSSAIAGCWNRGRHPERNKRVLVRAAGDQQAAAPAASADATVDLRRRLRPRGSGGLVRDGGGRAQRHPARRQFREQPAVDVSGLDPGRHALNTEGERGAVDDPPARRLRRGGERRQPGGDPGRVWPRRHPDRPLHKPAAADAGRAALVPRPASAPRG